MEKLVAARSASMVLFEPRPSSRARSRRPCGALLLGLCGMVAWAFPVLQAQQIVFDEGAGTIVEGSISPDGMFALVVTEDQDANVVVFLPEKRQVLRISGEGIPEGAFPYFEGLNHAGLTVLWGPNQEGNSFGILFYDAKWESAGVVLIDVNPDFGQQSNILPKLLLAAETETGRDRSYTFSAGGLDVPAGEFSISDSIDVRINFLGQSPRNEDVPDKSGTLRAQLSRTNTGPVATLHGTEHAGATAEVQGAVKSGRTGDDFRALRDEINAEIKDGDFLEVAVQRPGEEGRTLSFLGYLQGNVLSKLVYVDSLDDKNETLILYYWREGQLVSVFEVREGIDTQISEVSETMEIYNFENEKLVGWIRDGVEVDADDPGFADVGALVLQQSIQRAEPIYEKIGAD
jgi:hypothetical protein